MVKAPNIHEINADRRNTCYIGADPGQKGGLAIIQWDGDRWGWKLTTYPMPKTERGVWKIFREVPESGRVAIVESVHAMPGNGVSSMFKFGTGYGGLRMALIASDTPFETVTPQKWQKAMGVVPKKKTETKPQFKNRLLARAQELFPKVELTLATCDAALIALYCKRKHEGTL